MTLNALFILLMVLEIGVGVICATRCGPTRPLWLRFILLSPALSSLFSLFELMDAVRLGNQVYSVYWPDIARAVSTLAVYAVVVSLLGHRSWFVTQSEKER
ncbi:hypothetical protein HZU77_006900 [Neisseriaceae bacterium TC5R-5]|nr:hypothetical protein [Neisseriaceae bacterium TC5R-5]